MGDAETFERLIANLRSADIFVRLQAAQALGKLGDSRAVAPLIEVLDDSEWRASLAAAQVLGELGDDRAVAPIAQLLQRKNACESLLDRAAEHADAVTSALRKLGEPGFQALLRVARDFAGCEFPGVAAATALGEIHDARALDTLRYVACSYVPGYDAWPSADAAAEALSGFGEIAIPTLIAALRDPEGFPYSHIRKALQRIGPAAVPPLLEALNEVDGSEVRTEIVAALGAHHDDERVIEPLKQALSDAENDVRQAAAVALGERGDPSAIEQLLTTPVHSSGASYVAGTIARVGESAIEPLLRALLDAQRPRHIRINAAAALGSIGDPRAFEPLLTALRDDDPHVRRAAAGALGDLKDRRAVEPLLAALQDADADVRARTARALGVFGDDHAIPALAALATDVGEHVRARQSAVLALGQGYGESAVHVLRDVIMRDYTGDFNGDIVMLTALSASPAQLVLEVMDGPESWPQRRSIRGKLSVRYSLLGWLQTRLERDGDPRIREFLVATLGHHEPSMRHRAALILGKIKDERALDTLIEALGDEDIGVRWQAAKLLAEIGDERAIPRLEQAYANARAEAWWNPSEVNARDAVQGAILRIRARQSSPIQLKEGEE